jgi:hypothetical protein
MYEVFVALVTGMIGGVLGAYAEHWVLVRHMRGIDGLLRANYALAKRADQRAERAAVPLPTQPNPYTLTEDQIMELARKNGLASG